MMLQMGFYGNRVCVRSLELKSLLDQNSSLLAKVKPNKSAEHSVIHVRNFYCRAQMQSMQRMNSMMNSMFGGDPFGLMGPPAIMNAMNVHHPQNGMAQMAGMQMMPFGFPPMPPMGNMGNMGNLFSQLVNFPLDCTCIVGLY